MYYLTAEIEKSARHVFHFFGLVADRISQGNNKTVSGNFSQVMVLSAVQQLVN